VLPGAGGQPRLAARVHEPSSGRRLEIVTTQPGVQFYSGNQLDGSIAGKRGCRYAKHGGFCLEPHRFPDTPNHPSFPSAVVEPGSVYAETTLYRFGVRAGLDGNAAGI
jgi:aldose 1-epimerase